MRGAHKGICHFALAGFCAGQLAAQVTRRYEVVALQGDPAPSVSPTATYGLLGFDPRIGPNGHVVFGGFVGNNGPANYAIWTGKPGEIRALAVQGDPAPGRPAETLDVFARSSEPPYWVCEDGSAAFRAWVKPSDDNGVWLGSPGALQEVAIVNNPVPDVPGASFKSFPDLLFRANGQGEVMLRAAMEGGGVMAGNDTAVWSGSPDDLRVLAREGDPAPGVPGGLLFGDLTFSEMSLNARGVYCLSASLSGPFATNAALFLGARPDFTMVLQKGGASAQAGMLLQAFGKPRLNNDGTILFENVPPGEPRSFNLREGNGVLRLVAREGTNPPGAGGATWSQFFFAKPALGGNDFVGFNAGLSPGPNFDKDGTWLHHGETTEPVAIKGNAAPGFPGQTFQEFQWITFHRAPAVNADGTIIFRAKTNAGADGMWRRKNGEMELLLAVGDFLQLGLGDIRRVADFSVKLGSGGQSGEPSAFNDRGQLVFRAAFNTGALGTAILLIDDDPDSDGDGDGVVRLLEEAFGGDPGDPSDGVRLLPRLRHEGAAPKLVFLRRTDGAFTYEVEQGDDLESWSPSGLVPTAAADQSGIPAGTERVEVVIPAGAVRKFVQVRVTRGP